MSATQLTLPYVAPILFQHLGQWTLASNGLMVDDGVRHPRIITSLDFLPVLKGGDSPVSQQGVSCFVERFLGALT